MKSLPRVVTLTLHPAIDRVVRVERMRPGATFDGQLQFTVPAGKGVNTARSLRAICDKSRRIVAAVWAGGADAEFFESRLRQEGIDCAVCARPCATRQATTFLEADFRETHIKEAMPAPSAGESAALLKFWRATVRPGDIVAVCGSAPKATSPKVLKQIFSIARERGARFILADTNGSALYAAGEAGIDVLKGNAAEIGAWLATRTATARERLQSHHVSFEMKNATHRRELFDALAQRGAPKQVVITLGANGAVFASAREILHCRLRVKIDPRKIVSATGCGDAATAGILWSIIQQEREPRDLLAHAVACGAAKLFSADPGKLSLKSVRRIVRYCLTNDIEMP